MNELENSKSRRYPLLALSASFIIPGLGQMYNGEATKAILLFLGICTTVPIAVLVILFLSNATIWLILPILLAILFALNLYIAVDAFRTAKRLGNDYILQAFNQTYIYLLVLILGGAFLYGMLESYTREHWVESVHIRATNNLPNLMPGGLLFVNKRINCLGCKTQLQRGDLDTFVQPNNRTSLYIKRIIGLPGDQVDINGSIIKVNGQSIRGEQVLDLGDQQLNAMLDEHIAYREKGANGSYTVIWRKDAVRQNHSFTVGNGQALVLGDNRDTSNDSRKFGTMPLVDIVGKAKIIWFSKSADSIRWWRYGLNLDSNSSVNQE